MPLSPQFQAALDRAKSNAASPEYTVSIIHNIKGEDFQFRFRAGYSDEAIDSIGRFQDTQNSGDAIAMRAALADFIDHMCTDEAREQIIALRHAGVMDFQDLVALQVKVVEKVSAHPSMSSAPSPPGLSGTGVGLTPGASPGAPTPPPLP